MAESARHLWRENRTKVPGTFSVNGHKKNPPVPVGTGGTLSRDRRESRAKSRELETEHCPDRNGQRL